MKTNRIDKLILEIGRVKDLARTMGRFVSFRALDKVESAAGDQLYRSVVYTSGVSAAHATAEWEKIKKELKK